MKKVLFFLLLLACNRGYTQLSVVTGYDYIGRNTFHTGLAADIDISEHWGALLTTGVHLTGYEGSTRGIFEATGAISYNRIFAGATCTPYSVIPKIGVGQKDLYLYVGYAIPTKDHSPLDKGVAVGVNINPLYILMLPLALIIGDPLK